MQRSRSAAASPSVLWKRFFERKSARACPDPRAWLLQRVALMIRLSTIVISCGLGLIGCASEDSVTANTDTQEALSGPWMYQDGGSTITTVDSLGGSGAQGVQVNGSP